MSASQGDRDKQIRETFLQRFAHHAMSEKGLPSIAEQVRFALFDIRQKVVEEGVYGRPVTPHWREKVPEKKDGGGIHGPADTAEAPGIHGANKPGDGLNPSPGHNFCAAMLERLEAARASFPKEPEPHQQERSQAQEQSVER